MKIVNILKKQNYRRKGLDTLYVKNKTLFNNVLNEYQKEEEHSKASILKENTTLLNDYYGFDILPAEKR